MGWVFWLEVVWQLSTFSFHGNLQAPPVCLLPTWDRKRHWACGDVFNRTLSLINFTSCPQITRSRLCTHVCRALAVQYFLFLSASLSWPFLQHWPQTNIIFRFGGPNLLCVVESCWNLIKKNKKSKNQVKNTKQNWKSQKHAHQVILIQTKNKANKHLKRTYQLLSC